MIMWAFGCKGSSEDKTAESSKDFMNRKAVSITTVPTPPNWLTLVALDKGFFSQEGLDITPKDYPSGKRALNGMFRKEVDIATSADVPIVMTSFKRSDYSIFGVIGQSFNDNKIVANRDRAIQKPSDLKGKRIGVQKQSASHFFLYLFLLKSHILFSDIEASFIKVEDLPHALGRGEVDAISTREPFFTQAKKLLGDRAEEFAVPGLYTKTFSLVAFNDFIKQEPQVIQKILRALIRAEEFVKEQPEQASLVLAKRLDLAQATVLEILSNMDLTVSLGQPVLNIFADEARWAIDNHLTDKTEVPNLLDYLYLDGLKAVRPESVSIIH